MVDRIIHSFLINLGLTSEEIKIYSSLIEKGQQTILDLARHSQIPRTTVYRLLESMKEKGVVEEIVDEFKTKAKAVNVDTLEFLVGKKEIETQNLRAQLPSVRNALEFITSQNTPDTKVLFYRGKSGIEQMAWNTLRCQDEYLRGYSFRTFEEVVGKNFSNKLKEEYIEKRLQAHDLYSDEYLKSLKEIGPHEDWPTWKSLYINPEILNINHQLDLYNDVMAIYSWRAGEIFGVEIYNQTVVKMQKQIFETFWNLASKIPQKPS